MRTAIYSALAIAVLYLSSDLAGVGLAARQDDSIVLTPGASHRIPDTDLTVVFEAVVEDSRCPVGTNCVWAGDATVRLRVDRARSKSVSVLLHTNEQFPQEAAHDGMRLRLVSLVPQPTADGPPRPESYRATLTIRR